MQSAQFIAEVTGHREDPGHQVTPDDELRALAAAQQIVDDLTRSIARRTTSPSHAVFFVHTAERAARNAGYAQLAAADLAQRTLAHELPLELLNTLHPMAQAPAEYIAGRQQLPDDPRTVPTGRPTFKDTAELLQNSLRIAFFEARARMESVAQLFPRTDADGTTRPAQFAKLADELAHGLASPKEISGAAKRLQKLRPHIAAQPNPEAVADELESKLAASVRQDDPLTTKQLMGSLESALEKQTPEPTEDIINSRIGLFYRGHRSGVAEFLLRTRTDDAELLLSLCAQTDNPRTKAGNRAGLLAQSASGTPNVPSTKNPARPSTPVSAPPTPSNPLAGSSEAPAVFPDFLLAPDDATSQPLHTAEELAALTLDDGIAESADPFTKLNDSTTGADGLTPPQRHLQGLLNVIRAAGSRHTGKKETGLPAPQVVIIANIVDLEAKAKGIGATAHGQKLTPAQLRQALCQADVIPIVMNGKSQILDLGRSERYFPDYMRSAILARDGGCIVPGCTVPPEHLEFHHLDSWESGGVTRIRDGAPACSNHHHGFHTGQFKVALNADGLPAVILPRFMDPLQLPRRNTYWKQPVTLGTSTLF